MAAEVVAVDGVLATPTATLAKASHSPEQSSGPYISEKALRIFIICAFIGLPNNASNRSERTSANHLFWVAPDAILLRMRRQRLLRIRNR